MGKTYRIGKRFRRIEYLSTAVNCLVVFCFYFIYRYLFAQLFPAFSDVALAAVFLLLGAATAKLTLYVAKRYAGAVSYRVTDEGLLAVTGKREQLYRWQDFSGARLIEFQFRGPFPVEFQVSGKPMMLEQNIEGLCALTGEVFAHIAPYVPLKPELVKRAADLRGIY